MSTVLEAASVAPARDGGAANAVPLAMSANALAPIAIANIDFKSERSMIDLLEDRKIRIAVSKIASKELCVVPILRMQ